MSRIITTVLALAAVIMFTGPASGAPREINWGSAGEAKITLFYPGVTSWDFLTSDDHRLGGREIKKVNKDCRYCHLSKENDLDMKAGDIAAGTVKMKRSHNPFEPDPIPGKAGVIKAKVQAAYDNEYLYVRVEWDSKGSAWGRKTNGTPDRVSLQVNKGEVSFRKYGCFISCHNDLNTMPSSPSRKEVEANPFYRALNRDDVRLYAVYAKKAWNDRPGEKELEKGIKGGGLIDLWSIELEDGHAKPLDGWIYNDRQWEDAPGLEGSGSWANGKYVAIFKKRLKSKNRLDVPISDGEAVSMGLAIHDDGVAKRKHYVSFPFTVGLGTGADVKAVKVN